MPSLRAAQRLATGEILRTDEGVRAAPAQFAPLQFLQRFGRIPGALAQPILGGFRELIRETLGEEELELGTLFRAIPQVGFFRGLPQAGRIALSGIPFVDVETPETRAIQFEAVPIEIGRFFTQLGAPNLTEEIVRGAAQRIREEGREATISNVLPFLFSESGDGIFTLKKGGPLDISRTGVGDFAAISLSDPLNIIPLERPIVALARVVGKAPLGVKTVTTALSKITRKPELVSENLGQLFTRAFQPLSARPGGLAALRQQNLSEYLMRNLDDEINAASEGMRNVISKFGLRTNKERELFLRAFDNLLETPIAEFNAVRQAAQQFGDDAAQRLIAAGLDATSPEVQLARRSAETAAAAGATARAQQATQFLQSIKNAAGSNGVRIVLEAKDQIAAINQKLRQLTLDAGVTLGEFTGRNIPTDYLFHSVTPEFRQWLDGVGKAGKAFKGSNFARTTKHAAQLQRKFDTIEDMISWAKDKGFFKWAENQGIRNPEVLVFDPFLATKQRAIQTVKAVSASRYFDDIKGLGREASDELVNTGWIRPTSPEFARFVPEDLVFKPEVARAIDETIGVLLDERTPNLMVGTLRLFNRIWKKSVTIFWPAFVGRNSMGNIYLNALGGVTNPARYLEAAYLMGATARPGSTFAKMLKRGAFGGLMGAIATGDIEGGLAGAGLGVGFTAAGRLARGLAGQMRRAGLAREFIENAARRAPTARGFTNLDLMREAGERGVLGGHFSVEMLGATREGAVISLFEGRIRKARRWINDTAEGANRAVENHARLTHFIDKLRKNLFDRQPLNQALAGAEASTKRYLFDYGDLSNFERNVLRDVIPFYTFTRKNIALEVGEFLKKPAKFVIPARLIGQRGFEQEELDDLPSWMSAAFKLNQGALVSRLGTPAEEAIELIDRPITRALSSVSPLLRTPLEAATGRSFFFERPFLQRPLTPGPVLRGAQRLGGPAPAITEAITQAAPFVGRTLGTIRQIERAGRIPFEPRAAQATRALQFLTGIRIEPFERERRRQLRRQRILEELRDLQAQGLVRQLDIFFPNDPENLDEEALFEIRDLQRRLRQTRARFQLRRR